MESMEIQRDRLMQHFLVLTLVVEGVKYIEEN